LAWHVEDAAVHKGVAALAGPPQVICGFSVGNLRFLRR
jgi:hypothetical protein